MHYILLSASWAVLCYYAEDLRLKLPLQVWGMDVRAEGENGIPTRVYIWSIPMLKCQNLHSLEVCPLGDL